MQLTRDNMNTLSQYEESQRRINREEIEFLTGASGICDGPHTFPFLLNEGGQEPTNHQIMEAQSAQIKGRLTYEQIRQLQEGHIKCS